MHVYVYPTDANWYEFLSRQPNLDEVNFWRPGGQQRFNQLQPGDLLLFRLRSPHNVIGGGGTYTHFSFAPLSQVWDAFGTKNGTPTYETFLSLIARHRKLDGPPEQAASVVIGCIVLSDPFFFSKERWLSIPDDYPVNSPQGFRYAASTPTGLRLLAAVEASLQKNLGPMRVKEQLSEPVQFKATLGHRRLGQGAFSLLVADAYDKRCAVSGERTYPVLEAAHILPVSRAGAHRADNGVLLRADIHKLFDRGYVTVTPSGQFRVSSRLKDDWQNGRVYYDLDRTSIRLPKDAGFHPAREFLEWHADTLFKK